MNANIGRIVVFCWLLGSVGLSRIHAAENLCATATVAASRGQPPIGASEEAKKRIFYTVKFKVRLINKGATAVRIPSAGFDRMVESGPDYTKAELRWESRPDIDGTTLVESEVNYKPVVLRPKEGMIISWTDVEYNLGRLNNVSIRINITKVFGELYGFWIGEIEVQDVKIDRGKIVP